ncbi:aminotransferase class V-fold PLP-dependent enzyme [Shouchella clausii]|uniref:Aminotransferase n=1 Tax=Shouchella clausii TaxID=79880 RepID=A0A268RWB9_SHOCL|nr:aminotransferase class V-fold PLP-dependent enzyme [Shouchella clausii]PAD41613.1 aminotransferase [Bacillus sp. 7520-S]MEB5481384.1 aminotransferase class V-fold PLP-dependent enzyme [Shouchella clausii]MED4160141.1 aminotransferase class V-fold PLP-dependent enzyme [Shouchella clausii]MED4178224.1 aminotransferase class V-fold PLP-dependent enzyme [Shouchella clausii]PAD14131.1 aminotransferase [Shouchella clausii]
MDTSAITYKIADSDEEFNQIHKLNYDTFVEEIPQHRPNTDKRLIDRFNDENIYIIAKRDQEIIGMISVRDTRPFSLDSKLENLDSYINSDEKLCEIRLLSIKQAYRKGVVFYRLCEQLVSYCLKQGYTMALISGTTRQLKLYKRIGFVPFGPLVGSEEARYQPMYLTEENFKASTKAFQKLMERQQAPVQQLFLPGPVTQLKAVQEAWAKAPVSHRAEEFHHVMAQTKEKLLQLTNGRYVELAVGTGTLANEMVAAQLSTLHQKGVILTSGEFGERLVKQAERWGLSFDQLAHSQTGPVPYENIEKWLEADSEIGWLWTVHCETSTGRLYALDRLKEICGKHGVRLCLDACSSIGSVPVDLSGVWLASSVSGKGLAAYPGLALVFHDEPAFANDSLPAYLDIGTYEQAESIPFTHCSNGLYALNEALNHPAPPFASLCESILAILEANGFTVVRGESFSPAIITVDLSGHLSARAFGDRLKQHGIHVSYESAYLLERNWFQLALMGHIDARLAKKAVQTITTIYAKMKQEQAVRSYE